MAGQLAPILGLLALLVVSQWPLVRGSVSPDGDGLQFFGPYHMLVGSFATNGRFLLWNPYSSAGSPDYIEPQVGAASPLLVLTAWLGNGGEAGFRLYWLLIWFAGGAGMVLLGRHLRVPSWGQFTVAAGYMLSGFYVGNSHHTSMLLSVTYLPWIIWRIDVALRDDRWLPAAQGGVLLGLSGLGGYPGLVVLNVLFLCLWVLGRMITSDEDTHHRCSIRKGLTSVLLAGVLAAVVASPTYAAFLVEGQGYTGRTGALSRGLATLSNALTPAYLTSLAAPDAAAWSMGPALDSTMRSVYIGVLAPILAVFALSSGSRWRWWLLAVGLFFLAGALGSTLPVRGWLYDWFPPTRYFRHPALFRAYFIFIAAVLALLGARDIWHRSAAALRSSAVVVPLVMVLLYCVVASVAGYGGRADPFGHHDPDPAFLQTFALWGGALAVCLLLSHRPRLRAAAALAVTLAIVDANLAGLQAHSHMFVQENPVWQSMNENRSHSLDLRNKLAREDEDLWNHHLAAKQPTFRGYTALSSIHFSWFLNRDALRNVARMPARVWFSGDAVETPRSEAVADALEQRLEAAGTMPIVLHTPDSMMAAQDDETGPPVEDTLLAVIHMAGAAEPAPVEILSYRPNTLWFRFEAPHQGWLLITDRWARGWTATVNGDPVPIWGAQLMFRALPLAAGLNEVAFEYHPFGFPHLVIVSWSSVLAFAVMTVAYSLHRRRPRAR